MRRSVRGMNDVNPCRKILEKSQRLLDHRLHSNTLLEVFPELVDEEPEDSIFILETEHGGQAFSNLLLHDLFCMLFYIDLSELLQKVQVCELQIFGNICLLVRNVNETEDLSCQLAIHYMYWRAIPVVALRSFRGRMPTDQCAYHVHNPG